MAVEFTPFGRLHDGRQVTAAKLKNRTGASLTVNAANVSSKAVFEVRLES